MISLLCCLTLVGACRMGAGVGSKLVDIYKHINWGGGGGSKLVDIYIIYICRGVGVGSWGKQAGSMDAEPQVRGYYNITFICTPTNQETV